MASKEKSINILGLIALGTTTAYILMSRKNPETKSIEGINIDIDPEKMVENITRHIPDQKTKSIVENIAKNSISKIIG